MPFLGGSPVVAIPPNDILYAFSQFQVSHRRPSASQGSPCCSEMTSEMTSTSVVPSCFAGHHLWVIHLVLIISLIHVLISKM